MKWPAASAPDDRQFASQRERRRDFGERARVSGAVQAHDLEAGVLGRQTRSAADRADDHVGQGDRRIEAAIVGGSKRVTPTAASATHAASWPQAMKSAARPLA